MDYAQELKELLRPLGIYDVDAGLGAALLESAGAALTGIWETLDSAETESNPLTAENTGLAGWEALLPFVPSYRTVTDRRRAIAALLRIDGASFTSAALNDAIAGCGIRAVVEETDTPMTVRVSFPYDRGEPDNIDELRVRIGQILPCHLGIEYLFIYVLWLELEALFSHWGDVAEEDYTWRELERLGGEE